jgi:hypothetical protein
MTPSQLGLAIAAMVVAMPIFFFVIIPLSWEYTSVDATLAEHRRLMRNDCISSNSWQGPAAYTHCNNQWPR